MSAKNDLDFVVLNTRPLRRMSEDLDIDHETASVNEPYNDLIAAFNTVIAKIELGKLEARS